MDIRMMASGAVYKVVEVGYLQPKGMVPAEQPRRGRGGLSDRLHQDCLRHPRGRHRHAARTIRPAEALPGYKHGAADGLLRRVSRRRRQIRRPARRAGKAASSTTRPCPSRRKTPWRWASASAAAFWGFCTWRSSRSGWSGNTTWTSSPPRPTSSIKITKTDGTQLERLYPAQLPRSRRDRRWRRSRMPRPIIIAPPRVCGRDHGSVPEPSRRVQGHAVP